MPDELDLPSELIRVIEGIGSIVMAIDAKLEVIVAILRDDDEEAES